MEQVNYTILLRLLLLIYNFNLPFHVTFSISGILEASFT